MKSFWTTYGGSHVQIAKSMFSELSGHGDECIILAMPSAIATLKESEIPFKRIQDYFFLFEPEIEEIQYLGKKLALEYHNEQMPFDLEDTMAYYGISMFFLIKEFGEEKAMTKFRAEGRKSFLPREAMKRILNYEKPDVVCSSCTVRMELATMRAAKELGIVTAYFQDTFDYYGEAKSSDMVFLINDEMKRWYIEQGFNPLILFATGQPSFAHYTQLDAMDNKQKLCNRFGDRFPQEQPIILYTGQSLTSDEISCFMEMIDIARRNKEWSLIFKLHPTGQNKKYFEDLGMDYPENFMLAQEFDTPSLISASDMVITKFSTTGLEALLMNKPLLVLNLLREIYPTRYEEKGAALVIDKIEDLEKIIREALFDDPTVRRMKEARKHYCSSSDAVQKCSSIMKKIVCG